MIENITIEPEADYSSKTAHVVIWLHGLGADGHDFAPMAPTLQKLLGKPVRFIFPHAPLRPVTLNNGYVMRAWYDITGLHPGAREDQAGLEETSAKIHQLIQQQIQTGMPSENIFLGGFSQGCAAILYTGLRYPEKLGGLIALSGYLPLGENLEKEKNIINQHIPIFWGHGDQDTTVPLYLVEISCRQLQACGFDNLKFQSYPIAHKVSPQEIEDMGEWLRSAI
jgi:phospholipase/carboxylesterase